ncbi:MAG: hypothetical protein RR382_00955 [Tannerellaceae bacterium]
MTTTYDPGYVTVDMIRQWMMDNDPSDNSIDCDLAFTDEQIINAMQGAARSYNSLTPVGVDIVNANAMPSDTNLFINFTVASLLNSSLQKLSRNDMQWMTGGVTVDVVAKRIAHYRLLRDEARQMAREEAVARKSEINRQAAWASI